MTDDLDGDLKTRFDRELARVRAPATWSLERRRSSPLGVAVRVALVAALLAGATVGGLTLRAARESQTVALASPSPSAAASPSPTAGTASGFVTYDNEILGYRITLPEGYRRSISRIEAGQVSLGVDLYTLQTEREERDQCLRDSGDVGSLFSDRDPDIRIGVARNAPGISAVEWVTTPRSPGAPPLSTHQRVEPVTIGGREAVRLVADNATAMTTAFVIRANDRMYELDAIQGLRPQKTWLDNIAMSFVALQPTPFPVPTATTPPRDATRQLGEALAKAFAARDSDAVARLMPTCWIFVSPLIDGQPPGGVLYRSVALFTQGLRTRFAMGDLTVTIDPAVQVQMEGGRERYFVRSDWTEPDRTTRIDLFLDEFDGRWQWRTALHHYKRTDLINNCFPYRSPWTSGTGSC